MRYEAAAGGALLLAADERGAGEEGAGVTSYAVHTDVPIDGLRLGGPCVDWEAGIGEAEVPPGECRSIAITDEIRAADEAARLARENPAHAWTIKAELSVENLKLPQRKVAPGRMAVAAGSERVYEPAPRQTRRYKPRVVKAAAAAAAPVEAFIEADVEADVEPVMTLPEPFAVDVLADAPTEAVDALEVVEYAAEVVEHAPLPSPNAPLAALDAAARYCAAGCGCAVRPGAKDVEFCWRCRRKLYPAKKPKALKTVLLAADAEEHEANGLWAELSAADKWVVLEAVLAAGVTG